MTQITNSSVGISVDISINCGGIPTCDDSNACQLLRYEMYPTVSGRTQTELLENLLAVLRIKYLYYITFSMDLFFVFYMLISVTLK